MMLAFRALVLAPEPTLATISHDLADTAGGDSITVTGTDLADATAVTWGGTAGTITGATDTTVTFTTPAKSAGTYDVVVTTPGGEATLSAALEAWSPATDAGCTLLCERPSYSPSTWTHRVGSSLTTGSPGPPATSGAANFDGTGHLVGPTLTTLHGSANLTHFVVTSFSNSDALVLTGGGGGGVASNPFVTANNGNGAIGLAFGTVSSVPSALMQVNVTGTGNVTVNTPCSQTGQHAVIGTFDSAVGIDISVDGAAFVSAAGVGAWGATGGVLNVGARYDGSRLFRGEVRAIGILNATAGSTFRTKFYKWAKVRHGVA
jgi:hypothetical protein